MVINQDSESNYGEFEELKLASAEDDNRNSTENLISEPEDNDHFRLTSNQIQEIQAELKNINEEIKVNDTNSTNKIEHTEVQLQISSQQLKQLEKEINLLENTIDTYEENVKSYENDFHEAISAVNEKLNEVEHVTNATIVEFTTLEPSTKTTTTLTTATPSPKYDTTATTISHTTLDRLELSISDICIFETRMGHEVQISY